MPFWAGVVLGQKKELVVNGNYFLDNSINIESIDTKSNNLFLSNIETFKGKRYRLSVKAIEDRLVYFRFWEFNNDTTLNKSINGKSNSIVYDLPLNDFNRLVSPLYDRIEWRVGAYTVPFKLRFGEFNFDSNVNLGTNLGAKIRCNREVENGLAFEPIIGFGLASIKMDDTNSKALTATNISAFTLNTGVLFHINSSINLGLTWGYDWISHNDQINYNWKHNGKGWLGIGINVAFTKEDKNEQKSNKNQTK